MLDYENYYSEWETSTGKIFWSMMMMGVGGLLSAIYDVAVMLPTIANVVFSSYGSFDADAGTIFMGIVLKLFVLVGYVLCIIGLNGFAETQPSHALSRSLGQVRTGYVLLLVGVVTTLLTPLLMFKVLQSVFLFVIVYIVQLIAYFIMKDGYQSLMDDEHWDGNARLGARNLRFAAVCNIRLLLMPLIVLLISLFLLIVTMGAAFNELSHLDFSHIGFDTLFMLSDTGRGVKSSVMAGTAMLSVIFLIAAVLGIIWSIVAFFYPIIGWSRIKG